MKNIKLTVFVLLATIATLHAQPTAFYTQVFQTFPPAGWTNVDNTGNTAGTWKRVTTAGPLFTTRTNGYAIFDSDGLGDDGKPENASLTSAAINCSTRAHVALEFQSLFSQYANSSGKVLVSNDNTNWTEVYTVNSSSTANPEIIQLDISAVAALQATVYIRFTYEGDFDFFWAVDDIKMFEPDALDVAVLSVNNDRFVGLSDQTITGTIKNQGYNILDNVTLSYTDNGGNAVSQTLYNLNLGTFKTYDFALSNKIVMSTPLLHNVVVTAMAPNNGIDQDNTNNSQTKEITALSAIPEKNVLFEEFTTCQCGWCPAGHYIASQIEAGAPYMIPVNIHAGFGTDAMTTTEASAIAAAFANGAPTATVDRVLHKGEEKVAISRGIWEDKIVERHTQVSPATIDAVSTFDENSRMLNVTVTAKFYGEANGNFRVNCFILEDSVTGSGSGYNQGNYLSGTNGFQSYPTYSKPDPIPGYIHRHVERQALGGGASGGAWGTTGVVPSTTANEGVYSTTYSVTLNANWNASRCKLVAFVHEYNSNASSNQNQVFNVVTLPLNGSVSQTATPATYISSVDQLNNPVANVTLYPNPATDAVTLEFNLSGDANLSYDITNLLGQVVYSVPQVELNKGGFRSVVNTTDYNNGIYLVSVKNNGRTVQTVKFVVSK